MKPDKPFTITAEELSRMRNQTFVWSVDLAPSTFDDEDMTLLELSGTLTLRRQLNVIKCQGDLLARASMISGRTLEPFEAEFPVVFEEGIEVTDSFHFPEHLELGLEDAVEQVQPDEPIDMTELIRQHIILNLPATSPDAESDEVICYNYDPLPSDPSEDQEPGPAWDAIRKTVESWEQPSDN